MKTTQTLKNKNKNNSSPDPITPLWRRPQKPWIHTQLLASTKHDCEF